jgi:glycosyltransferase involved in cell wall biosynthesis
MRVSVIIPTYNEKGYIEDCLKSIFRQSIKPDEIIVVNNNSTDGTMDIVKKYPEVRIVQEKTQGMIYARNKGFNSAKYEIVARTDADARVPKDWIKRIKTHFEKDPDLLAVSGPAHFYGIPSLVQVSNWPTKFFFRSFQEMLNHDCLFGPNMALRRSAWRLVKNEVCLEDNIVHEDIDLSIHLAQYGKLKFDSKLVVSASFRRWKRITQYFEYTFRALTTIERHKRQLEAVKQSRKIIKGVISRTSNASKRIKRAVANNL